MSDPYFEWLGIPAQFRPPTHYQLLGIAPTELDRNTIVAAAERQLERVRIHESGPAGDESRRIASEIHNTRDTLLDPVARQRYDSLTPDAAAPWWKPEGEAPATFVAAVAAADWWKGEAIPSPSNPPIQSPSQPVTVPTAEDLEGIWSSTLGVETIAVGANGTIVAVKNATTSALIPVKTTENLHAVTAMGAGVNRGFIAVGDKGTVVAAKF